MGEEIPEEVAIPFKWGQVFQQVKMEEIKRELGRNPF